MSEEHQRLNEQRFVEEVGLHFEQAGAPRMAGRIVGWLLICDPPHQSTGELAEALLASKGSISSATRLLIQMGMIERISLPGQRRDYFSIKPNSWDEMMKRRMAVVTDLRVIAERGLQLLEGKDLRVKRRLEEMRSMYAFWERELPALMERWEEERKG
ncbi:MAG: MarR family transcriptional regulator [Dehalococcoidia bacterium]